MRKNKSDILFLKQYKKTYKKFNEVKNISSFQKWMLEILTSFLWLKSMQYNMNFNFNDTLKSVIYFVFINKKEKSNLSKNSDLVAFYELCNEFYSKNSKFLQENTIINIFARNHVLKNIIIFVKRIFSEDIDFIINKIIKIT